MPQVAIGSPLDELKLPYQSRIQPSTLFHLFSRESLAPPSALCFRKVGKRTFLHFRPFEAFEQLFA